MSRSTRDKNEYKPFTLSKCIKGVYLKRISYYNTNNGEGLVFDFRAKPDYQLTHFLAKPNLDNMKRWLKEGESLKEKWTKEAKAVRDWMEFIFSRYLTGEQMVECRSEMQGVDADDRFKVYSQELINAAEQQKYWEKELWLKTVLNHKGDVTLPKFTNPPFLKLADSDEDIIFEWTDYEKGIIKSLSNRKTIFE